MEQQLLSDLERGGHFLERQLRYADLVRLGVVRNRASLKNWIDRLGFPPGRLIGNTRLFSETKVRAWLDRQATEPKATPRRRRNLAAADLTDIHEAKVAEGDVSRW